MHSDMQLSITIWKNNQKNYYPLITKIKKKIQTKLKYKLLRDHRYK